MSKAVLIIGWMFVPGLTGIADVTAEELDATRQSTLRGAVTPEREWWNLLHYKLEVEVQPETKSLVGTNHITLQAITAGSKLQIDLQPPLRITEVLQGDQALEFSREGNVTWVCLPAALQPGAQTTLAVRYSGQPAESQNPPWSGGLSWKKDSAGNDFIATSCQGIGASIWWPCKDHGYDEPEQGMQIDITVPESLTAVSNGRLLGSQHHADSKKTTYHWRVTQPIKNYCVNMNIGRYVHFAEKFVGERGELDLDYWVLESDREAAAKQFTQVPQTLEAFEYWFGPYPFYEDSYKLVQVPYLGMEHQSSVTYGNGFRNGYRGTDRSGTGVGLKFDFIIVHESAHEWWGNNISMRDVADMWIHESFANYAESLFVEYFFTQREAQDYVIGCRHRIRNDRPIIGTYDLNQSGSNDMYEKGGNMLHTLRHIIDNDLNWRKILRGLNEEFRHQVVTTQQVEAFVAEQAGLDLSKFFKQYLRTNKVPKLVASVDGHSLNYHFENVVEGFSMPLKVHLNRDVIQLQPSEQTQTFTHRQPIDWFDVDRNFYIELEQHVVQSVPD
jgi:aminopeptidase N